ncbi:MAG TPA: M90 family metallopeptidase [Phycisphaerae bacterium]|nr:M90 family metallopeptidase [Phycisphaerae bacterium]
MLHERVGVYHLLPMQYRPILHRLVNQFIKEKEFWGSRELPVTDEMRVIVAAQACVLVLNLDRLGLYPQTREVVIYPRQFGQNLEAVGPDGAVYAVDLSRTGEVSRRGPVLLDWQSVLQSAANPGDGHNVVFHEFAHALDYLSGEANGAPPLERPEDYAEWSKVLTEEHRALMAAASMGRRILLDPYGAQNPAEFFAVATEHFFEQGRRMQRAHPALYAQLRKFYGLNPAEWG